MPGSSFPGNGYANIPFRPGGPTEVDIPSAYTRNYYHGVFGTRGRAGLITPQMEERLYPFMGGTARDLNCQYIGINGMADHVHMLVRYPLIVPRR